MSTISKPSIQSLFLELKFDGRAIGTATGFIVASDAGPLLITNRHVVTGRDQLTGKPINKELSIPNELGILHNEKSLGHWITSTENLLDEKGIHRWFEHPTLGEHADIVALKISIPEMAEIYPHDVPTNSSDYALGPSNTVSVVGFPFGRGPNLGGLAVWATGFVASEPDFDHNELPVFLIDCRARRGQSGSPVIFHRDGGAIAMKGGSTLLAGTVTQLLGVYSGRINEKSDLGMVWKTTAIQELVSSVVTASKQ